jgi:DNA-binding transcriptional ArsR family regulator
MLLYGYMSSAPALDRVFHALSDTTRRTILERLERSPETTGALATAFPKLSRVAVMKHLGVLESAGLVSVKRQGRFRWNELKRDPLEAADDWLGRHFERRRDMGLRIKLVAEEKEDSE